MSRIGKKPIKLPKGVKATVNGVHLAVEGPAGKLERDLHPAVEVKVADGQITVTRKNEDRVTRSVHGLTRTLIDNMVQGAGKPFERVLEISGVGYRAELQGSALKMQLGLSHDVIHPIPAAVKCKVDKQVVITLTSADKELLGQVAAEIRRYRPAEPYKGKGVKYAGERIRRKEGKTGAG
jgi:large subunit ribosomal protein L6